VIGSGMASGGTDDNLVDVDPVGCSTAKTAPGPGPPLRLLAEVPEARAQGAAWQGQLHACLITGQAIGGLSQYCDLTRRARPDGGAGTAVRGPEYEAAGGTVQGAGVRLGSQWSDRFVDDAGVPMRPRLGRCGAHAGSGEKAGRRRKTDPESPRW
jgi:hypothetical protein